MNGCIYRTEHDVCKKYTTDKSTSFCVGRNCLDRKPSNSDRIRAMTDEELAEFMNNGCDVIAPSENCTKAFYDCKYCWIEWLQAESGGK